MTKIASWNVNSIRTGIYSQLEKLIREKDPDIICFQETRCTKKDGEKYFADLKCDYINQYPYRYWNDSIRGHYGVSTWSKIKPDNIYYEIPDMNDLKNGRIIIIEFNERIIINTYVPNTGRKIAEEYRNVWHNSFMKWLPSQLNKEKLVIWCGDFNVVDEPSLDTTTHNERDETIAGLKEFEKRQFDEYKGLGLIDVYRHFNKDTVSPTWYSNFNRDNGWRLDYFLINDISKVNSIIHKERMDKSVSDHTWLFLTTQ